jgi:membrane protein
MAGDRDIRGEGTMRVLVTALAVTLAAAVLTRKYPAPVSRSAPRALAASLARPEVSASRPLGWTQRGKTVVLSIFSGISEHRVLAVAAGVAFYSLLAIFPAIAALVSLYGLFADPHAITHQINQLQNILPGGGIQILRDQLSRLVQRRGTLGITFAIGLLISLWSANSGVAALFDALNVVRGEREQRSLLKLYGTSLIFTLGGILFVVLAMTVLVVLPIVINFIGADLSIPAFLPSIRWPVLFILVAFGLALLYRFGPSCSNPKWHWVTVGSLFATFAWLGTSYLFSWYTAHFGSYNKTYGSLGAVVGFMTWIWISVIVILIGAELDVAIEARQDPAQRQAQVPGEPVRR